MSDKGIPSSVSKETLELNKAIGYLHAALDALNDLYLLCGERGDVAEEDYFYENYHALDAIYWSLINH